MIALVLPLILAGGLLNRVRGGLWGGQLKIGTQGARILFAIGMAVLMALITRLVQPSAAAFWMFLSAPLWLACEFLPNGDYLGMTSIWQFLEATAVGIGNVLLPAGLLYALGYFHLFNGFWWLLLVFGGLKGVIYWISNDESGWWPLGNVQGFSKGAEMAECLYGLVLVSGLVGAAA